MELVDLGTNPNADLVPNVPNETLTWNNIDPLHVVSLYKQIYYDDVATPFTTVGFGNSGALFVNSAGVPTGWVAAEGAGQSSYGTKRYVNSVTTGTMQIPSATFPGGPYSYRAVTWSPGFGPGQGAIFGGDSGSPMLSSDPINYTSTPIPGVSVTVNNVYTDELFGVVTLSTYRLDGFVATVNTTQAGVLLTPADVCWINQECAYFEASVPEPGTWCLWVLGMGAVFVTARCTTRTRRGH